MSNFLHDMATLLLLSIGVLLLAEVTHDDVDGWLEKVSLWGGNLCLVGFLTLAGVWR